MCAYVFVSSNIVMLDFIKSWIFSADFQKKKNSTNIKFDENPYKLGPCCVTRTDKHVDGRKDRRNENRDEANRHSSQFCLCL
jgi:hypothetical protein